LRTGAGANPLARIVASWERGCFDRSLLVVERSLLTVNTGSSSLKVALYRLGENESEKEAPELFAEAERIGLPHSLLRFQNVRGDTFEEQRAELPDHAAALRALLDQLRVKGLDRDLVAVGHRVVHGGDRYREPQRITAEVLDYLRTLIPTDPDHMPQALAAIEAISQTFPAVPQVACFDTAFHGRMPRVARIYALPRWAAQAGVVRYGFHGLSCEYVMEQLRTADPALADGRIIIAHLGNGASMTAVRGGVGIDTTMGFTPTGGLVMGTRTGDLDPGVLLHMLLSTGMAPAEVSELVNREAGLLGVSGESADMRDLLSREEHEPHAAEAISLFCYQAKKFLGALAAVLGGLDTLVFTGGIGAHAAPVRWRICEGLGFLGIRLVPRRNAAHAPIISCDDNPVTVRVMRTNEDLMIARRTRPLTI
jgi:acetate kinase